jgi:uncharacterized SAM-binding protein YcdF (DUF218 family)
LKKRIRQIFILVFISAWIFASVHFVFHVYIQPYLLFQKAKTKAPYDAVIIPGIPCDQGKWGFIMKKRVLWSVYLYKTGVTKNIIYSGSAVRTPYNEGKIMALYAEKLGVPSQHIYVEPSAEHTTENVYYSYLLCQQKSFHSIGFATDPFQTMKIESFIRRLLLPVDLIPMVIPVISEIKTSPIEIESWKAYTPGFISIDNRETREEQEFYSAGGRVDYLIGKKKSRN